MAITYIGSTATSGDSVNSGDWTLHANWQPGDTGVFWWYCARHTSDFTEPAGVTQKHDQAGGVTGNGQLFIGYRNLQTGDTTFGWTGTTPTGAGVVWGVDVFRGVDASGDPFEAESGSPADFTDVNDPDGPAVVPVTDNACVYTVFGKANDYSTIAEPSGYTLGSSISETGSSTDSSFGSAYRILSGGASVSEDPPAWTLTGGISTDDGQVWTGALKEGAGGGAVTIAVPVGSFTMAGLAAVLSISGSVTPGVGSATATGHAPVAALNSSDVAIAMPAGSLAASGAVAALTFLGPDVGVAVITGHAPAALNVSPSQTISPGDATARVEGIAPSISIGFRFDPPAGTLRFNGLIAGESDTATGSRGRHRGRGRKSR